MVDFIESAKFEINFYFSLVRHLPTQFEFVTIKGITTMGTDVTFLKNII